MLRNGYKHTVEVDGQIKCFISNEQLYIKTKTRPLEEFIDKQFLKFQAHISRMPNSSLPKQLQSRKSSDHNVVTYGKSAENF